MVEGVKVDATAEETTASAREPRVPGKCAGVRLRARLQRHDKNTTGQ